MKSKKYYEQNANNMNYLKRRQHQTQVEKQSKLKQTQTLVPKSILQKGVEPSPVSQHSQTFAKFRVQ